MAVRVSGPESATMLPPEERFWQRYSPHGEAPLSVVGSFALHALAVGGMILAGLYLASLFNAPVRSLPVEVATLAGAKGDGGPGGDGGRPGAEDVGPPDASVTPPTEAPPALALVPAVPQDRLSLPPPSDLLIPPPDNARQFLELEKAVQNRLTRGPQSGGANPGKSGRPGQPGDPAGGKRPLTPREERMLRWHMGFNATSATEYLAQLRGLGAILAVPVKDGPPVAYKVIRDLRPGARLLDEDLSKIQRIYWIDNNERSVRDILAELKVDLPKPPDRFVAFMPVTLEKELFRQEREHVEKVLRQPFDERRIGETRFEVVRDAGRYRPKLLSVTLR
ncbi:MAG: hypothetical protein U0736_08295 [Gemmataceae bacterium]